MYNILLKMKKKFEYEQWLKMVDQAKARGKLTDEEYKKTDWNREKIKQVRNDRIKEIES